MSSGDQGGDKSNKTFTSFTVDDTQPGAEMPSVTRLLNRRKLGEPAAKKVSNAPEAPRPLKAPTPVAVPVEVAVSEVALSAATPTKKIKPAKRNRAQTQALTLWSKSDLAGAKDVVQSTLSALLGSGLKAALFLAIEPPPPGSKTPVFGASQGFAEVPTLSALWTGVKLDPRNFPEVWNPVVRSGISEISPGPTVTPRNKAVRVSVGAQDAEYVTFARVGPSTQCRGILVLISGGSIRGALEPLIGTLSEAAEKKAA